MLSGWKLFAIPLLSSVLSAQQPNVLAPHDPIAPRITKPISQTLVPGSTAAGPWIVDSHFQSNIYLKNIVETSAIPVTPVLHMSDGTVHRLPDVLLEPAGIANIDISASLETLGIVPNATLSGWVELQYNWAWDPLCAMIRVLDTTRSLIFTFGFGTPESMASQSQHISGRQITEGMWWKQEPKVTGFVALANTTSKTIIAKLDVSDTHNSVLGSHTVTVPPHCMEMLDLIEMQSASTNEGGIRVTYFGEADALLVSGALEDIGAGYDANIPFAPPAHAAPPMAKATVPQGIVELGLMAGAADPYMHFPDGIVFTPYSVLRNISNVPISVTPTLWWMKGTAPKFFQLSQFRLLPFETRTLDVPSMLKAAGLKDFSGYANLALDTGGQTGLLMASGSVDQKYNYSFPVVPRGILPSASKSIAYWSTGNGDDTMVTMWNPADEVQNFILRLVFSSGHYDRLITLQPRATYMFSISEIMAAPGPDLDGNVIPAGTHEGSAEILGIEADNQSILIAEDAAIYNIRKATCGGSCQNCDGATSWTVPANPFAVSVGGQQQESLIGQFCSGGQYDYTSYSTWSSSNTGVGTVQTGLVRGVSAGSLSVSASTTSAPVCAPQCNPYGSCPAYYGGGGQSPGNVRKVPAYAKVQSDIQGNEYPSGNPIRLVTYRVYNQDGTVAAGIPIGESYSVSGWNCNTGPNNGVQPNPPLTTTSCNGSRSTGSDGSFQDGWGWYIGYGPAGCGLNITDHWQMCSPSGPNPPVTFMTLTGYIHTNGTQINGYAVPGSDGIPQNKQFGP